MAFWAATGVFVILLSQTSSLVDNLASVTCSEAMQHCEKDTECAHMLQKLEENCDPSIFACELGKRDECIEVLSALQTSEEFRSCTCERQDPDHKVCLQIQNKIFLHACVSPGIGSSDVPWVSPALDLPPVAEPHIKDLNKVYPNPFDHDYETDVMEEEEHPDRVVSCIGHRKHCLMDEECKRILTDYRLYCSESKKLDMCVTTDWAMCYKTIAALRVKVPDLFTCTCHMRRADTKEKCDRIHSRIGQNNCLVAAPYFIHTAHPVELTYDNLIDRLNSQQGTGEPDGNTCSKALMKCNSRSTCRNPLKGYLEACKWDLVHNACQKEACLRAIRNFYLFIKPDMTQSLLFCTCGSGDKTCEMAHRAVKPVCSVVDIMPPTCSETLARCNEDRDCASRLQNFEKFCSYDKHTDGCAAGSLLCRNAVVGTQGTILTTNCTCETVSETELPACLQAKSRLQQDNNLCTKKAKDDFHVSVVSTPRNLREDEFWSDEADHPLFAECRRALGKRFPSHLSLPIYTRQYRNDSDCSQICHCQRNGSVACKKLPCLQNLVCKWRGKTYDHGAQFNDPDRGQCRCIRSEVVCAKHSGRRIASKQGLFLHVGYSVSDQHLIESSVPMTFEPADVRNKLATLLNGDSAQQFCRLELHLKYQGNLIFRINVATYYRQQEGSEACIAEAKELNYRISTRDFAIITDTQLSVLKVSQLEAVEFHSQNHPPAPIGKQQGLDGQPSVASRSHTGNLWSLLFLCFVVVMLR